MAIFLVNLISQFSFNSQAPLIAILSYTRHNFCQIPYDRIPPGISTGLSSSLDLHEHTKLSLYLNTKQSTVQSVANV